MVNVLQIVLALALALANSSDSEQAAWNRFRGPNGTGIAAGTYPARIGPEQSVHWQRAFPAGHSSPSLSATQLFLTGVEDEKLFTYALERATGKTLWQREAPRPRKTPLHGDNHPAAASAAVDADTVVVFFDEFGLLAYEHDGTERWRLELGPFDNVYGMGASPIIVDDIVVLPVDQSTNSYVVGVSKVSGEEVWRRPRPQAVSGHCTPVVHRGTGGVVEVLLPGSYLLDAYDAKSGERRWWVRGLPGEMKSVPVLLGDVLWTHGYASPLNDRGNQILLPAFDEALASMDADKDGLVSADEIEEQRVQRIFRFFDLVADGELDADEWEKARTALSSVNSAMALRVGGEGDMTDKSVLWTYHRGIPQLPSPLVYGETYYMLEDRGGLLTTLDPQTGERIEKTRLEQATDAYFASPVAGDDKVFLLSQSGILSVLAKGTELKPIHTAEFGEQCYATPTLEDGDIYLRTETKLYCFR